MSEGLSGMDTLLWAKGPKRVRLRDKTVRAVT